MTSIRSEAINLGILSKHDDVKCRKEVMIVLQWFRDEAMGWLYVLGAIGVLYVGAFFGELVTGQLSTKGKDETNDPS
jgi:hypothetical protein